MLGRDWIDWFPKVRVDGMCATLGVLPRVGDSMLSAADGVFENCSDAKIGGRASFRRLGWGESSSESSPLFLIHGLDLKQQPQFQYYLG